MAAAVHNTLLYLCLLWSSSFVTETLGTCDGACDGQYEPVCGSDGTVYSNLCVLEMAKCSDPSLVKVNDGGCGCDLRCKDTYAPVCGSNNVTYNNSCFLNAAKCNLPELYKAHVRECNDGCDKPCPEIYSPVCGSDAITYDNECLFEIAKCRWSPTTIARYGHCSSAVRATSLLVSTLVLMGSLLFMVL